KLSLAEREEHELQQAVAMSLNQNLGHQETGVTTKASQPNFGPATGDYYDEGNWSMTLFNPTSREIVVSPDPVDRKRIDDEPAFIRPSPDNPYLGGL
ncbi:ubiquitin interaction motif protein, partial [Aspergillus sclerotialis]